MFFTLRSIERNRTSRKFSPSLTNNVHLMTLEHRSLTAPAFYQVAGNTPNFSRATATAPMYDEFGNFTGNFVDDNPTMLTTVGSANTQSQEESTNGFGANFKESGIITNSISGPAANPASNSSSVLIDASISNTDSTSGTATQAGWVTTAQRQDSLLNSGNAPTGGPAALGYVIGDSTGTNTGNAQVAFNFSTVYQHTGNGHEEFNFTFAVGPAGGGNYFAVAWNGVNLVLTDANGTTDIPNSADGSTSQLTYTQNVAIPQGTVVNVIYSAELRTGADIFQNYSVGDPVYATSGLSTFSLGFGMTIEN